MDLNGSDVPKDGYDVCHNNEPDPTFSKAALVTFFLLNLLLNLPALLIVVVNRRVQEIRNVYTATLAAADTLVSFNGLLGLAWVQGHSLAERVWLCTFFKVYLHGTLCLSLVTLLLVSIDRLLYIRYPFFYICNVTRCRAGTLIAVSWLSTVTYVLLMRFSHKLDAPFCNGQCDVYTLLYQSQNFAYVNSAIFSSLFFIPFLAHILIWSSAISQARKLSKCKASMFEGVWHTPRHYCEFCGCMIWRKSVAPSPSKCNSHRRLCDFCGCMIQSPIGRKESNCSPRDEPSAEPPASYSNKHRHSLGLVHFPKDSLLEDYGAVTIPQDGHPVSGPVHAMPSTPDSPIHEESKTAKESYGLQDPTRKPICIQRSVSDTMVKRHLETTLVHMNPSSSRGPRAKCFLINYFNPMKRCTRNRVSDSSLKLTTRAVSKQSVLSKAIYYSTSRLRRHIPMLRVISPAPSSGSIPASSCPTSLTKLEAPRVHSILRSRRNPPNPPPQPSATMASLCVPPPGVDNLTVPGPEAQSTRARRRSRGSITSRGSIASSTSTFLRSKLAELRTVRFRVARKLLGVFVSLCLCWLPMIVLGLMGPLRASPCLLTLFGYLAMLNSTANALVYTWSDCDMREALKETMYRGFLRYWLDRVRVGDHLSRSHLEWGRESRVACTVEEWGKSEGGGRSEVWEGGQG